MIQSPTKKLALTSVLTALALIFSYIEFLIPISIGFPGAKLGFANLVIIIALFKLGSGYAFGINIIRILLSALLFGNMFSAIYALCGGVLSIVVMILLKKTNLFSVIGVSMAGGVFHNIGQLLIATVIIKNANTLLYFPVLLLLGMAAGIINGIISTLIMKKLEATNGLY